MASKQSSAVKSHEAEARALWDAADLMDFAGRIDAVGLFSGAGTLSDFFRFSYSTQLSPPAASISCVRIADDDKSSILIVDVFPDSE